MRIRDRERRETFGWEKAGCEGSRDVTGCVSINDFFLEGLYCEFSEICVFSRTIGTTSGLSSLKDADVNDFAGIGGSGA